MTTLPRQALCDIVHRYGKDVCNDYKRVRGLLNDLCGGNDAEINYLLTALDEHVATELLKSASMMPYEMLSARLISNLCTNRGMREDIAHWTVDSWAMALGVISRESSYTPSQTVFHEPRSSIATPLPGSTSYTRAITRQSIIVAPNGGHYTTISAALKNAAPNTLILVKPGHYHEGLVIDQRIEIKGDGPQGQIIVESEYASCIQMITEYAVVQGLTLISQKNHTVDISGGKLILKQCDITSKAFEQQKACVAIQGSSAYAEIRQCRIHDAKQGSGIFIESHAEAIIEDCDIFGNELPGISIIRFAKLSIKRCSIYGGNSHGIFVGSNGSGTIEDCDIYGNALSGVKVRSSDLPIVKACHIYRNAQQEEWVYQNGMGNTRSPRPAGATSLRRYPEPHSNALPTSARHTIENMVSQEEVARQQAQALKREIALKHELALMQEKVRQQEITHQQEHTRLKELLQQQEQAHQQKFNNQQARAHQQEQALARQKEAARRWEQDLMRQKEVARQWEQELARQKELARQQELAHQQELARHQEIARKQAAAYQQSLARQQELARELALAREAAKKQSFLDLVLHSIRPNKEKLIHG